MKTILFAITIFIGNITNNTHQLEKQIQETIGLEIGKILKDKSKGIYKK